MRSLFVGSTVLSVQEHQTFAEGTDAIVLCPAGYGSNPLASMIWTRNNRDISGLGNRVIAEK